MTAPFGIQLGSAISNFDIVNDAGHGKYFVNAPKPHPQFDAYVVQATEQHGVVWVKGLSPNIENDAYGHTTMALVDKLGSQLESRYGRGSKGNFLLPDSIWTESRDWMAALAQGERVYNYMWDRASMKSLPEDLSTIFVGAIGVDFSTANVVIEYASTDLEAAERNLDNDLADLL